MNYLLNEFSITTDKILEEMQNQEYDQVNFSLDNRKEIINKINEIDYNRDEFTRVSLSLNLAEKEKCLDKALKERFQEKRDVLKRISEAKHANQEYHKAYSVESIFISKKI